MIFFSSLESVFRVKNSGWFLVTFKTSAFEKYVYLFNFYLFNFYLLNYLTRIMTSLSQCIAMSSSSRADTDSAYQCIRKRADIMLKGLTMDVDVIAYCCLLLLDTFKTSAFEKYGCLFNFYLLNYTFSAARSSTLNQIKEIIVTSLEQTPKKLRQSPKVKHTDTQTDTTHRRTHRQVLGECQVKFKISQ